VCQNAAAMKPESWRTDKKYDRGHPKSTITSWAASILVFGYLVAFAISPALQTTHSTWHTCTVVIDCVKKPIILHIDSFAHRAFVVTLKGELKFLGNLLHRFA
jgi:hypothetical protein